MGRHRESQARPAATDRPAGLRTKDETPDPLLRTGVVVQTLLFGLLGIGTTFTQDGPTQGLGTVLTYAVCISTIPVARIMSKAEFGMDRWSRRAPVNNWFVVYCELGVTVGTATYSDPLAALQGAMLLALVGAYAAHFARPKVLWFHVAWSTVYVLVLGASALATTPTDSVSVILRVVVAIMVINGAVTLLSAFSRAVLHSSRVHLSDAMTDPLTGVLNRRGLEAGAVGTADGPVHPALVLIDIDHFKAVNDHHGHSAGDVVLRLTAMRLTISAGRYATVSRLGGDEFVVLVPDPTPTLGEFAERLRHAVHNDADDIPITVSVGAALPHVDPRSTHTRFDRTLAAADEALYRAKRNGRNRVALARPPDDIAH
ncbi:GGDEF domain-containing protein [Rhodococcus sp. 1R11]|uniref:GGDEF domain-containing protein n=1 Tax=Rhodococcus sp. 1R11 TaxID=2559614 RepID=UPI0010722F8A|nr:GGDEF domain-containing protein [Rhodococcus sp. 1R11]TFI42564.1 GGDEF domain-containing protein [Rhodococcus sp. 1R11]